MRSHSALTGSVRPEPPPPRVIDRRPWRRRTHSNPDSPFGDWLRNPPRFVTLFIVLTALVAATPAGAQDLFAEVFGTGETQEVLLPVTRNGVMLGEVGGRVSVTETLFRLDQLRDLLTETVNPATLSEIDELLAGRADPFVPVGTLTPLGISTIYRPESVELVLEIDPGRLRERVLSDGASAPLSNLQEPAPVAGYVNLRARGLVSSVDEQRYAETELEPVLNVRSWVAEGSFVVSSRDDPVNLVAARLVRDLPSEQIRWEAGTPRFRSGPLLTQPDLVGLSATRREELRSDLPLARTGRISFVVPRRGQVEVRLNGRVFRTYTLQEGPHSITDLPLGRGSNSIQVLQPSSDGEGVVTIADIRLPYAPGLLETSRHRYSYAAGTLRDDAGTPVVSGFHEYGVGERVAVTGSVLAVPDRFGVGSGVLVAGYWGTTSLDGALSGPDGTGASVNLSHVVSRLDVPWSPVFEATTGWRNAAFRDVVTGRAGGAELRAGLVVTQRLPGAVSAGLGAIHRYRIDEESHETDLRLLVAHQSAEGFAINAQLGPVISDGKVSWQGSLFVRITDPTGTVSSSASYDVANGPATLSVNAIPRRSVDTIRWSAGYQGFDRRDGQPQILRGTVGYDGYRFSTQVEPTVQRTAGADEGEQILAGQFSSAVAFAGRTVAVSRPIRDSFVIVTPRAQVAPYTIPVRGSGGAVIARLEGGATVVPDLMAYRSSGISLDGINLPDGFSLGADRFSFAPGYRSGYAITVGSRAVVYARGRLVDQLGAPLSLQAGEVVASDGSGIPFFTNGDGEFEITGLSAGEYRLFLYADPDAETVFAVPDDVAGRYDLDDVVFFVEEQ
jgi:outer membrane usher protein